jgi:hypothetical protein
MSNASVARELEPFARAPYVTARLRIFMQVVKIVIPSEAEGPAFTV